MKINSVEEFERNIKDGKVLVDFYADWCPPCRMLSPIIEEIESKKIVRVLKVNVDELRDLALRYQIFSIPTLIIFKDGREADRIIGLVPKDEIIRRLERV
jgi:thioredoxin 1